MVILVVASNISLLLLTMFPNALMVVDIDVRWNYSVEFAREMWVAPFEFSFSRPYGSDRTSIVKAVDPMEDDRTSIVKAVKSNLHYPK